MSAEVINKEDGSRAPAGEKSKAATILKVSDLKIHFPIHKGLFRKRVGEVKAVNGVSFEIKQGETLGLVGESGCGKSTTGRAVLRLYDPTAGEVIFEDRDIAALSAEEMRATRPRMQMIFQDPQACLNPRMTVGSIIAEPLVEHTSLSGQQRREKVMELLEAVGLNADYVNRYPHEFSGGQRQRIGIARALALDPDFIVCDEPIAALDVSIQAQVVNLLEDLQRERGLTYLFISHDLSMVRHIADRVAVMYLGKIVELSTVEKLFDDPKHPYTQALLSAVPVANPEIEASRERVILTGDVPNPSNPPEGCVFCTRCPVAVKKCFTVPPVWRELNPDQFVACHLVE